MQKLTLSFRFISTALGLAILQACSTAPQTVNKTPYFDGVIRFNGEAVENVKVLLSRKGNDLFCLESSMSTSTDKEGKFSLKPVQQQQKYVPFVNYEFTEWVVCAEFNERRYTLHANNQYDTERLSQSVFLECELSEIRPDRPCKIRN